MKYYLEGKTDYEKQYALLIMTDLVCEKIIHILGPNLKVADPF